MEAVTFPDVEAVVVAYLNQALTANGDTAKAATMIPNPRPNRLVKVTRTGGQRATVGHELAQVTLECWDIDGPAAANLARLVRGYLSAMLVVDTDTVVAFTREIGGPVYLPDPLSNLPRYRLTVQLMQKSQTLS